MEHSSVMTCACALRYSLYTRLCTKEGTCNIQFMKFFFYSASFLRLHGSVHIQRLCWAVCKSSSPLVMASTCSNLRY